jgi:hypothetical protein
MAIPPITQTTSTFSENTADCPPEFLTLVKAVHDSKVHITPTSSGYHIHFGDRTTINSHCCDFSMNGVSISNCGTFNLSNNVAEARGIKIPLDKEKIRQALSYMQSAGK